METKQTYQFPFETGSKKHICPSCKQKTFTKNVNSETGEYVGDEVGVAIVKTIAGIIILPPNIFKEKGIDQPYVTKNDPENLIKPEFDKPIDYISLDLVQKSMNGYRESNFAKYIITLFGAEAGSNLLLKYFVGRAKADNGKANIFWRVDAAGMARTGKIMVYHPGTGKRNKEVHPVWAHNSLKPFNHELCFFGEHLISEHPSKTIAISESEKTAIIASFFFPQFIWLATGGASGCKWREYSVFRVLKDREVILFPDFGMYNKKQQKTCYQEWSDRAKIIMERMPCNIRVSNVLEKNIPEEQRVNDYDLVDMLIKQDEQTGIALTDDDYPAIWDYVNNEQ